MVLSYSESGDKNSRRVGLLSRVRGPFWTSTFVPGQPREVSAHAVVGLALITSLLVFLLWVWRMLARARPWGGFSSILSPRRLLLAAINVSIGAGFVRELATTKSLLGRYFYATMLVSGLINFRLLGAARPRDERRVITSANREARLSDGADPTAPPIALRKESWWLRVPRWLDRPLSLTADERVIWTWSANRVEGSLGGAGGRVWITTTRLVFLPVRLPRSWSEDGFAVDLSDLDSARVEMTLRGYWEIPVLTVETREGQQFTLQLKEPFVALTLLEQQMPKA
jgi:hypothetical protein